MSIYMLKLGFLGIFNGLWTFPRVWGPAHIKEWCFGHLILKLHYPENVCAYAFFEGEHAHLIYA